MDTFFTSQKFDDIESFTESVVAWDVDFRQLSAGAFLGDISQFGDEQLSVNELFLNQNFHQQGSAPAKSYTFAFHHQDSKPHRWRFQDCPMDGLIIFPENNELQSVSPPNFHQYVVSIREDFFTKVAIQVGLAEPQDFIRKGEVVRCVPGVLVELRNFLELLFSLVKNNNGLFVNQIMNYELKWKIARMFLLAISSSTNVKFRKKRANNHQIIKRVLEYIDSDISVPRSIPEICHIAEVNERTLRNIFYDYFSLSPQKYQKCYRLNIVRKALQVSSALTPQIKIVDIANTNGFWHMGQFAKDYRKLFSELPSETLEKNR